MTTTAPAGVRAAVLAMALIFAGGLAYDLLRMPVQLYDSLELILAAQQSPSIWATFRGSMGSDGYLRPFHPAQIKALFDLADGHYWLAFRGFHALLLAAGILLFVRALRVRTRSDVCAAAFALAVLTGMHTFGGFVQEAYPINHYLEAAVCCLIALNLAQSTPRHLVDVAAALTFTAAALTLESGLLVWVVAVAARMSGMRGISGRGLAALTVLLAGYLYLRFASLSVGLPGLDERSSGYLFERLDPAELNSLFGDRVWWFYAYNVVTSLLSVILSEPQGGVFVAVRAWTEGDVPPRVVLAVVSSVVTTAAIAWAMLDVARRPASRGTSSGLLFVFAAVLAANSLLSFPYTKDAIVSVAGVFYALAAYAAVAHLLERGPAAGWAGTIVLAALLIAAAPAWAVRSLGVHHVLRTQAFKHRNDWAHMPATWRRDGLWPADVRQQQLILELKDHALDTRPPNPAFAPRWMNRVWGD